MTRRNGRNDIRMTGLLDSQRHWNDRVGSQDPKMESLEPLLTVPELATYLGVPVATIYGWRYRGDGPPGFRVGRYLRYRWGDVEAWMTEQRQAAQIRRV